MGCFSFSICLLSMYRKATDICRLVFIMRYFAERNTIDLDKQIGSFLSHMTNTHTHTCCETGKSTIWEKEGN